MTTNDATELFARVSMHEFMLEILFANLCANWSDTQIDSFLGEVGRAAQRHAGAIAHTPEAIEQLQESIRRTDEITAHFLKKVRSRLTEARRG
jgi:hypothetical protein